jgi:methionyl-tRNA formyltransferase
LLTFNMKIVFFGTPEYVLPILDSLHKTFKSKAGASPIVAVVTQKPKPAGRKRMLAYSPIDTWAHKKAVPVYYDGRELIEKQITASLGVLAAYGAMVPNEVINIFPSGILNVHPSLLPKYRGASPVQATIVSGDKEAGVSIVKLDEELDHGPIISQSREDVYKNDTTETLRERLFEKSATVLTTLIPAYMEGKIKPREQDHKSASFTSLVKKADGFIPPNYLETSLEGKSIKEKWKIPFIQNYILVPNAHSLECFVRAMQPWPVAWTEIRISRNQDTRILRLRILKAHVDSGKLVLDEVQLEGKNPVAWKQFKEAYAVQF